MNITSTLLTWYKNHKRNLPWRVTRDPYKIWLSEIILQQTRIDQGLDYYNKFVSNYPDVDSLAKASEMDVLKLWQGLGYYSRARNLHATAMQVFNQYQGKFPGNYNGLIQLKGIGDYTAAAIASIAYNEPVAVVDGNVLRFLARFYGITVPVNTGSGKKMIARIANELIDPDHPGDFNQAMMEFGALYCKPRNPDCINCIFNLNCKANLEGSVMTIPVKNIKSVPRKRYFHYLVFVYRNEKVYLKKRVGNDIWKNLYDFPIIEKDKPTSEKKMVDELMIFAGKENFAIKSNLTISKEYKHVLTHQVILARFYIIEVADLDVFKKLTVVRDKSFIAVRKRDLQKYPVPRLIEIFLQDNFFAGRSKD